MAKRLPKSDVRDGFDEQCRVCRLPIGQREFVFEGLIHAWRYDLAWPHERVIMEIEGGAFLKGGGRHTRGSGFRADIAKYNYAATKGFRVIRVMPEHVRDGSACGWLRGVLLYRPCGS